MSSGKGTVLSPISGPVSTRFEVHRVFTNTILYEPDGAILVEEVDREECENLLLEALE